MSETTEKVIETTEKTEETASEQNGKLSKFEKKMERTPVLLTIWQLIKYSLLSLIVTAIQILLQYILPLFFDRITTVLPSWLSWVFNADSLFSGSPEDYAKYVVAGIVTWGYVLPFFIANYTSNIIGYIMNKKRTFKSDAPRWHFVIYFLVLTAAIIVATWIQGVTYGWINHIDSIVIHAMSRFLITIPSGFFLWAVLFIAQKILLPPRDAEEKKSKKNKKAAEEAEDVVETADNAAETAETTVKAAEQTAEEVETAVSE